MRVFELLLGFFVFLLALRIGYFAMTRVTLLDRKIKLFIGAVFLAIVAVGLMAFGFDF